MDLGLGAKAVNDLFGQARQVDVGGLQLEPAGLDAAGLQQTVDEVGEVVRLLGDDVQALLHGCLVPLDVVAEQGLGIALDQGHGRLELVGHDRDERGL